MDEKLKQVKQILEKNGQEQLLDEYNRLTDENEKQQFLDNVLTIDFNQVKTLYENCKEKPEFVESDIKPIDFVDKTKLTSADYEKYENIGLKEIKNGKLAVVTMAGGQGTRLGHTGPKGTFDLGLDTHKSIFEILCDTINDARSKYGVDIPWYIMTSDENNEETERFFESHNYFGYPKNCITFFKQGKLPMISTEGKILIDENHKIKQAADGHGGIFHSMLKDGVIFDMKARGIEWIFIGGVDNVLVKPVDPVLIGLSISKNVLAAGKSIVKANPNEKVGVFCKRNGKPSVIEYSEISEEMAEEVSEDGELKYGESHILCNLFNIKAIEKISEMKLPYHIAHKKAKYIDEKGNLVVPETPNAYKFEAFLFDAFESLDDIAILRVKREEEFAPVKNAEGVDSPETARKLYIDFHKNN
jgi:UDP-N-acetylglucosamine pyrophosphorylase